MPYYLYKISTTQGMDLVKNLDLIEEFSQFSDAKQRIRKIRAEQSQLTPDFHKIVFADNVLQAEELLLEAREKPVLMEHEI